MRYFAVLLGILLLALAACRPEPIPEPPPAPLATATAPAPMATRTAVPTPTATAVPGGDRESVLYMPLIVRPRPKAGLAMSTHERAAERVAILDGSVGYYRAWQIGERLQGDQWGLTFVPSLWCDFYWHPRHSNGQFRPQLHVLELLGRDYDGYLLFLNEPDLPGQCNISPFRAAQIYIHTRAVLPNAKLVGPGISHEQVPYRQNFAWLSAWWREVLRLTGQPPDMYAWDLHLYWHPGDPLAPYDAFEIWLNERGVKDVKFFISEWGVCNPDRVAEWRRAFDNDPRILHHFFYDQSRDGTGGCMTLFNFDNGELLLSPAGAAFVAPNAPYPGPGE